MYLVHLVDKGHTVPYMRIIYVLACVASVSVGFGSKERPRNVIFGVFAARKLGREPKNEIGGRGGEGRNLPLPLFPLFGSRTIFRVGNTNPRKRLLRRLYTYHTSPITYYIISYILSQLSRNILLIHNGNHALV